MRDRASLYPLPGPEKRTSVLDPLLYCIAHQRLAFFYAHLSGDRAGRVGQENRQGGKVIGRELD